MCLCDSPAGLTTLGWQPEGTQPGKEISGARVVVLGAISEDPVCPRVCGAAWEAELVKGGGLEGLLNWALETRDT